MTQLCRTGRGCVVRFGAPAASALVHDASNILPIGIGFALSNEFGEHHMNEQNIAVRVVERKAGNYMPPECPLWLSPPSPAEWYSLPLDRL